MTTYKHATKKWRLRNRKLKGNLQNEVAADLSEYNHDSDSSDDIMKDIRFSNGVMNAEREIMDLYKEAFNVDPLDRSPITLTSEQRIERAVCTKYSILAKVFDRI